MESQHGDKPAEHGVGRESGADASKGSISRAGGQPDAEGWGKPTGDANLVPTSSGTQLQVGRKGPKESTYNEAPSSGTSRSQPPGESSVSEAPGGETTGEQTNMARQRSRSETTLTSYSELEGQLKENSQAPSAASSIKEGGSCKKAKPEGNPKKGQIGKGSSLLPTTVAFPASDNNSASQQGPPKVITTSATGTVRSCSAPPPSTSSAPNVPSTTRTKQGGTTLRRGKWTVEEEAYVARVIQDFNSGFLDAPAGTTLRTYLSEKLQCDPMRITKKFTGDACIGKRVFHPAVRSPSNAAAIDKAQVLQCMHML